MSQDLRPIDILHLLADQRLTLADIDRLYNLPAQAAKTACHMAHARGEAAIAEVLGRPAHSIWPSRYDANGERLKPQPPENYIVKPQYRRVKNADDDKQGQKGAA